MLVTAAVGLVLVALFVLRSLFRAPEHPLMDLQLFRNRALTVSVIAMSLFAIAFFGASLLFPSYFLQVRGESTLLAGFLLAALFIMGLGMGGTMMPIMTSALQTLADSR